jgi:hypothetical protein
MVNIHFGELRVGTVSSNSGIFAGSNQLHHFQHKSKQNQAFGTVEGKGTVVLDNRAWLDDRDQVDTDSRIRNRD